MDVSGKLALKFTGYLDEKGELTGRKYYNQRLFYRGQHQ